MRALLPVAAACCSSLLGCTEPTASAGPAGPSSAASGFPEWRPSPGAPPQWAGSLGDKAQWFSVRPGFQHQVYLCNNSQTHWRRAAPEPSVPPGTSTWVRRGASVSTAGWSGTEPLRAGSTSGTAAEQSYKPLTCSQRRPTHQSAQSQEPHEGTGGQQLEEKGSLSFI